MNVEEEINVPDVEEIGSVTTEAPAEQPEEDVHEEPVVETPEVIEETVEKEKSRESGKRHFELLLSSVG